MPIKIGCDPEFLVLNDFGHKQNAKFLTKSFPFNGVSTNGIVSDHCGRVGELRPGQGTPQEVTQNIKTMMKWIKEHHSEYKIIAGGGNGHSESIGGHIHFSGIEFSGYESTTRWRNRYNRRLRQSSSNSQYELHNMDEKQRLVYALDFYIGRRLKRVSGGRRGGSIHGRQYGRYGDIETKSYGFEYRTPPSWLTDPFLTESVLAIAWRIAKMWELKPSTFDMFIENKKRSARKKDYNLLIGNDEHSSYMRVQIANFKRIIFSKIYKMDTTDLLDNWTKIKPQSVTEELTTTRNTFRKLNLQACQLKLKEIKYDFQSESVIKVVQFAKNEVTIYPLGDYSPWQFQLIRDIRLRPDTIYFSKDLRPFLKIKRGTVRTRFIEIRRRVENNESMKNVIFYNSIRSTLDMQQEIIKIFETGARKKITSRS